MKVHGINKNNINIKGLKINYDAEHRLRNADASLIGNLFNVGKAHESNLYIDILVLKNLSYRIKEKANPFFCLMDPISLNKVADKKINISAIYDGVSDGIYKKGDKYSFGIEYETSEKVDSIIEKFKDLKGLKKIAYVAKLIEDYLVKTNLELLPKGGNREAVVTLLMDKYGDIVV